MAEENEPQELELIAPAYRVGTTTQVLDSNGNPVGLATIEAALIEEVDDSNIEVTFRMNLKRYPQNTIHL
jgi:hypothetical protein